MNTSTSFKTAFYIRSNRNIKKDYSVYCCIKISELTPKELHIIGGLRKEEWDLRKGRPKQTTDYLIKLTLYLESIRAKLFEIFLDLKLKGNEITPERIKKIYLGKDENDFTILKLIELAIANYGKELSPGSLKNYGATKKYLEGFCKSKYKYGDVPLKFLTYSFIDELKTYILNNPLKPNDPCNNNGCMKHLERLKKIITWAYEMRFIDKDVFASFKIKKNSFDSLRLHWQQLIFLQNKCFQRPLLDLVKDLFIFSCYTGLAPADVQALKPHQIFTDADGISWLSYVRAKTKVPADVPLLTLALDIINKYKWKKGDRPRSTTFPHVSNQVLNKSLKIISEVCEFGISLNFYIARYTFATTVTLLNGVPITSIKGMMGHRKIESTYHYTKVDKSIIAEDMKELQQKLQYKITT